MGMVHTESQRYCGGHTSLCLLRCDAWQEGEIDPMAFEVKVPGYHPAIYETLDEFKQWAEQRKLSNGFSTSDFIQAQETKETQSWYCGGECYVKFVDIVEPYRQLIQQYYGDRKTERSDVLYTVHIDQGLLILQHIGSTDAAKKAFCLHPIFQNPPGLRYVIENKIYDQVEPYVLMLAMEYRNKANSYLCRPKTDHFTINDCPKMIFDEVRDMLIADKVQNYTDFQQNHLGTHERSEQLEKYFKLWLEHLGVDQQKLHKLQQLIIST